MSEIQIQAGTGLAADVLVEVAKVAGWQVIQLDDDTVVATFTTHYGEESHVVTFNPTADDLPARRSIDNTATDATSQTTTVLEWLIGTAIKSAEHRGSEGTSPADTA